MRTNERLTNLRQLGYTDREAAFLLTAALHSGVFVMRQYSGYAGVKPGALTEQFASKAKMNGHVRSFPTKNRTLVYQIRKPIFQALGDPDNRNRRIKQPNITRLRLMSLDFVLAHPDRTFHATEEEKIDLFSSLAVASPIYPARTYRSNLGAAPTTRCFVEKYPIYTKGSGAGFAFICESSVASFEAFLDRYLLLMASIPEAEVVYVSTMTPMIEAARVAFARKTSVHSSVDFLTFEGEFQQRAELEAIAPAELEMERLRKLRILRQSPRARFYDMWKRDGLSGLQKACGSQLENSAQPGPIFSPCLLPETYAFL